MPREITAWPCSDGWWKDWPITNCLPCGGTDYGQAGQTNTGAEQLPPARWQILAPLLLWHRNAWLKLEFQPLVGLLRSVEAFLRGTWKQGQETGRAVTSDVCTKKTCVSCVVERSGTEALAVWKANDFFNLLFFKNFYLYFFTLKKSSFYNCIVPMGFYHGKFGLPSPGKAICGRVALPTLWCMLSVVVFP